MTASAALPAKGHAPAGKKCHHMSCYGLTCQEYEELRFRASEQIRTHGDEKDLAGLEAGERELAARRVTFTAAYIRRKVRERGVAALPTGPKPRGAG